MLEEIKIKTIQNGWLLTVDGDVEIYLETNEECNNFFAIWSENFGRGCTYEELIADAKAGSKLKQAAA